jgi:nickel superoxide dismutase
MISTLLIIFGASNIAAHCEIPCGIYDDELRAKLLYEHTVTIEKSMQKITALSKENPVNYNQITRWVSNKEDHASQVQHIVSQYFMTQRIKPDAKQYSEKIVLLHKMLLASMKCKQTTDQTHVNTLHSLLKEFEILYFGHSLK